VRCGHAPYSKLSYPQLASYYEGVYESKGVTLVKGSLVTAVHGSEDGKVGAGVAYGHVHV
jgi:hypothetical protein